MASVIADTLPGLEGHSACLVGDYMLVYGGKTGTHAFNDEVYALNLTTLQWNRLHCKGGTKPMGRAHHTANMFGWRMFCFGGLLAVGMDDVHYNMFNAFANVDALDQQALQQRGSDRLREPRQLRKVTQQKKESVALHVLDLEREPTWSDAATYGVLPPPRSHHASAIHRSTLYIYGGYSVHTTGRATDEELKAVYSVYALNMNTMTWSVIDAVNSVPPKLWGMSSIVSGDIWVMFGGVDITQCSETNSICAWHLDQGEWRWLQSTTNGPPAVNMHKAVRFGDKMFMFGGAGDVSSLLFNETYAFDLLDGSWIHVRTTGEPPLPRHGHSICVVGTKLFVFGGMDYSFSRGTRVWALDMQTFEWSVVSCQFSAGDIDNVHGIAQRPQPKPATFLPATPVAQKSVNEAVQTLPTLDSPQLFHTLDERKAPADFSSVRAAPMQWMGEQPQQQQHPLSSPPRAHTTAVSPPNMPPSTTQRDPTDPLNRTNSYAVAWSNEEDVLHGMRNDIAKTKSVLSNMLDAASARATRETNAPGADRDRMQILMDSRADEARHHLGSEIEARTARVRDFAQVSGNTEQDAANVQQYWKKELDELTKANELWRQATVRENALIEEAEKRRLEEGQRRSMKARNMVNPSSFFSKNHTSAMQATNEAMFPNSAANKIHDPQHPQHAHQPIKLQSKAKAQYVSPSLMKLGLAGQLGQKKSSGTDTSSVPLHAAVLPH